MNKPTLNEILVELSDAEARVAELETELRDVEQALRIASKILESHGLQSFYVTRKERTGE